MKNRLRTAVGVQGYVQGYPARAGEAARLMSTPVEGGRTLLRGRILGFPVHLDVSFLLIITLLGYRPGVSARDMVLWVVIATLAVLVHELGHAVAARAVGAQPDISLIGFGGVTTFTPPRPLSRARSLGISLAGPMVGLMFGGAAWLLDKAVGSTMDQYSWQYVALWTAEWTCLGWSWLNLLPVLPLDGGQAMRELLPGDPTARTRRAAAVSVVVAAIAALLAILLYGLIFLALFMVFFGLNNVLALRQLSAQRAGASGVAGPGGPAGSSTPGTGEATTPEQVVVGLLWRSDPAGARRLLESLPPGTQVDLAVHGAVLALAGDRDGGHALLAQELQRRPGDVNVVALLVLTQTLEHDWDAVLATVHGRLGSTVPNAVVERAVAEAQGTGREDVAGRLTVRHRPT
jgi:Zn-dependent protease